MKSELYYFRPQYKPKLGVKICNIYLSISLNICFFVFKGTILGSVTPSIASLDADPGITNLIPAWAHTFLEIDHEIIPMATLFFPLIQEWLLSVTSESMC